MADLLISREGPGVLRATSTDLFSTLIVYRIDRKSWRSTPAVPGVYLLYGFVGEVPAAYVGMSTTSILERIRSHHVNHKKDWFGTLFAVPINSPVICPAVEAEMIRRITDAGVVENRARPIAVLDTDVVHVAPAIAAITEALEVFLGSNIFSVQDDEVVSTDIVVTARTPTTAATIIRQDLIHDGATLTLKAQGTLTEEIKEWLGVDERRGRAVWRSDDPVRTLEWEYDVAKYSMSGLAQKIIYEATGESPSINGSTWWATSEGATPYELAGSGRPSFDWSILHRLLGALAPGEWTTYGELAKAIGTAPQPLGGHISDCSACLNAWRVLGSDGRPREGFRWDDSNDTRSCRKVLEDEGVRFGAEGAASPEQRVTAINLEHRLESH
jgi:alkylated DNA nucleotide flippase Atl1